MMAFIPWAISTWPGDTFIATAKAVVLVLDQISFRCFHVSSSPQNTPDNQARRTKDEGLGKRDSSKNFNIWGLLNALTICCSALVLGTPSTYQLMLSQKYLPKGEEYENAKSPLQENAVTKRKTKRVLRGP
jgi:hypothetical protein